VRRKFSPVRRVLQPVHGEIEVAAQQARVEAGKGVLFELDPPADLAPQGLDQIDLEADVLAPVFGVHGDVRRPALGVGGPDQRRQIVGPAGHGDCRRKHQQDQ
jgi:hypothetical protein